MNTHLGLIAIVIGLSGCSTQGNKRLDEKISTETDMKSRATLQAEAKSSIDHAINLTDSQKAQLSALRRSVTTQADEFNRESLELRSVLMKDMIATNYNSKEVSLIKNRMRQLEDRRLTMIFDSVDQANVIMGRQAVVNQKVMGEFLGDRNYRD